MHLCVVPIQFRPPQLSYKHSIQHLVFSSKSTTCGSLIQFRYRSAAFSPQISERTPGIGVRTCSKASFLTSSSIPLSLHIDGPLQSVRVFGRLSLCRNLGAAELPTSQAKQLVVEFDHQTRIRLKHSLSGRAKAFSIYQSPWRIISVRCETVNFFHQNRPACETVQAVQCPALADLAHQSPNAEAEMDAGECYHNINCLTASGS